MIDRIATHCNVSLWRTLNHVSPPFEREEHHLVRAYKPRFAVGTRAAQLCVLRHDRHTSAYPTTPSSEIGLYCKPMSSLSEILGRAPSLCLSGKKLCPIKPCDPPSSLTYVCLQTLLIQKPLGDQVVWKSNSSEDTPHPRGGGRGFEITLRGAQKK